MTATNPATPPRDLEPAELERLRAAERWMVRFFVMGVLAAAVGIAFGLMDGVPPLARGAALGAGLALIVSAVVIQLRLRCPVCKARLAMQSGAVLPDRCTGCGTAIPRPARMTSELDN